MFQKASARYKKACLSLPDLWGHDLWGVVGNVKEKERELSRLPCGFFLFVSFLRNQCLWTKFKAHSSELGAPLWDPIVLTFIGFLFYPIDYEHHTEGYEPYLASCQMTLIGLVQTILSSQPSPPYVYIVDIFISEEPGQKASQSIVNEMSMVLPVLHSCQSRNVQPFSPRTNLLACKMGSILIYFYICLPLFPTPLLPSSFSLNIF